MFLISALWDFFDRLLTPVFKLQRIEGQPAFPFSWQTAQPVNEVYGPVNILPQAIQRARAHVIEREGYRETVYRDSLGYPTVGYGHLVLATDNLKVGDTISRARALAFLDTDLTKAANAAYSQFTDLKTIGGINFLAALISVNFQLGENWNTKFYNTWNDLLRGKYQSAIYRIQQSKWMQQTPVRANDFIAAINAAYSERNT